MFVEGRNSIGFSVYRPDCRRLVKQVRQHGLKAFVLVILEDESATKPPRSQIRVPFVGTPSVQDENLEVLMTQRSLTPSLVSSVIG